MKELKGSVLVVDDIKANVDFLLETLGDAYEVAVAMDGESALQAVAENRPDIILLDIMMSGMDGYEVCRRLKADTATEAIPVIFITAMTEVVDETKGLELGAVDYISKPFSPAIVLARVKTHFSLLLASRELEQQNETLEVRVAERTEGLRLTLNKLHQASLGTITRLARAAEYRDEDTGEHILRMSYYSAAVARQMGLGDTVAQSILYAAPMHDVGKIGIDDKILLKPGPLNDEEWVVMKTHTTIGGKILSGAKTGYLMLAEIIALTHHEHWDGTGYPYGYKGKQIPLVGRIAAISDVFDALTIKRPYKNAFALDKSFGIIQEGRGTHFDPEVVDAFFQAKDEILAIKEKYSDGDEASSAEMSPPPAPGEDG